jgi:hypothetical protein
MESGNMPLNLAQFAHQQLPAIRAPRLWFALAECRFELMGVASQRQMFYYYYLIINLIQLHTYCTFLSFSSSNNNVIQ